MVVDPLVFLVEKTRGVYSGPLDDLVPAARVDFNVISDVVTSISSSSLLSSSVTYSSPPA